MPNSSDNTIAIVSVLTSGIITPSIIAVYALRARRREEAHAEREHQLTLLAHALNDIHRQLRLLHDGFDMWRRGADHQDAALIVDHRRAVASAIEAVWLTQIQVQIRFGEHPDVYRDYMALIKTLDRVKEVHDRYGRGSDTPTHPDIDDWNSAVQDLVRTQETFVRTIRQRTSLQPRRLPSFLRRWPRTLRDADNDASPGSPGADRPSASRAGP